MLRFAVLVAGLCISGCLASPSIDYKVTVDVKNNSVSPVSYSVWNSGAQICAGTLASGALAMCQTGKDEGSDFIVNAGWANGKTAQATAHAQSSSVIAMITEYTISTA